MPLQIPSSAPIPGFPPIFPFTKPVKSLFILYAGHLEIPVFKFIKGIRLTHNADLVNFAETSPGDQPLLCLLVTTYNVYVHYYCS